MTSNCKVLQVRMKGEIYNEQRPRDCPDTAGGRKMKLLGRHSIGKGSKCKLDLINSPIKKKKAEGSVSINVKQLCEVIKSLLKETLDLLSRSLSPCIGQWKNGVSYNLNSDSKSSKL